MTVDPTNRSTVTLSSLPSMSEYTRIEASYDLWGFYKPQRPAEKADLKKHPLAVKSYRESPQKTKTINPRKGNSKFLKEYV